MLIGPLDHAVRTLFGPILAWQWGKGLFCRARGQKPVWGAKITCGGGTKARRGESKVMQEKILPKWENLSFWFRNCCVCRFSAPPVPWLCRGCWQKLRSLYLSPRDMIREQGGLTHVRLFDWGEENDFLARHFLNSLKKGGSSFIFNTLAKEFLHRFLQVLPLPDNTLFIPAPARSRPLRDHAFSLCQAFSQISQIPMQNPLMVLPAQQQGPQKQKNRRERKEIHFQLKEPLLLKNRRIVFVDDILTTGATARSAHKALGKPQPFMIFTLSWRRLLQEEKPLP